MTMATKIQDRDALVTQERLRRARTVTPREVTWADACTRCFIWWAYPLTPRQQQTANAYARLVKRKEG